MDATIFIFAPSQTKLASYIAEMITLPTLKGSYHIFTTIDKLQKGLPYMPKNSCIAIAIAENQTELDEIVSLAPFIERWPLILMLPDNRTLTITKAHILRPRYIVFENTNLTELRAVINKMLLWSSK